jgi:hypothetical protein
VIRLDRECLSEGVGRGDYNWFFVHNRHDLFWPERGKIRLTGDLYNKGDDTKTNL